jgi:rhomboid protease GluP
MILLRRGAGAAVEEIELDELIRRVKAGAVGERDLVCYPELTGTTFVPARELEVFRLAWAETILSFRRAALFARVPYVTLGLVATLVATFVLWQGGAPTSADALLRLGAKSSSLMVELGQWWRLVTANLVHLSVWHLAVNSFFLFNLGGPLEAVLRRLDFVLVLVVSALASTLASLVANPELSAGASGLVFGVWGAAAVFGVRYRNILPARYRLYYLGAVIPYAALALISGLTLPGVDNWAHVGGLTAGAAVACFSPARLLAQRHSHGRLKVLSLAGAAATIGLLSFLPLGPGPLAPRSELARFGLVVPVPSRWHLSVANDDGPEGSFAFGNSAGVTVGMQHRRQEDPVDPATAGARFVAEDMATHLAAAGVSAARVGAPEPLTVAGVAGSRVRAEVPTATFVARAEYLVLGRGHERYVVSFTAPAWLFPAYEQAWSEIVAGLAFASEVAP